MVLSRSGLVDDDQLDVREDTAAGWPTPPFGHSTDRPVDLFAQAQDTAADLVTLIEGMYLRQPAPSLATVAHRTATTVAAARDWPAPSYTTVRNIVGGPGPGGP